MYEIYTDGGCDNIRTKAGSWCYVVVKEKMYIRESSGLELNTTNNRVEYLAVINAMNYLIKNNITEAVINTDSQLLVNTYNSWMLKWYKNGTWKKTGGAIKNIDLVKELYSVKTNNPGFKLCWVKGHSGIEWNEYCDEVCSTILNEYLKV